MNPPTITTVRVKRLGNKDVYPPVRHFIAESPLEFDLWKKHLELTSRRRKDENYPIHLLDQSKLQYIVAEGENVDFEDEETGVIIGSVRQKVVNDELTVKGVTFTLTKYLNAAQKSIRVSQQCLCFCNKLSSFFQMDDPGLLVSVGYTSGSNDAPQLGWARNLKKSANRGLVACEITCVHTHVWNKLEPLIPSVILEDFEAAKVKLGGLTLDAGTRNKDEALKYTIRGDNTEYTVSRNAPPSGVAALNYSA